MLTRQVSSPFIAGTHVVVEPITEFSGLEDVWLHTKNALLSSDFLAKFTQIIHHCVRMFGWYPDRWGEHLQSLDDLEDPTGIRFCLKVSELVMSEENDHDQSAFAKVTMLVYPIVNTVLLQTRGLGSKLPLESKQILTKVAKFPPELLDIVAEYSEFQPSHVPYTSKYVDRIFGSPACLSERCDGGYFMWTL